MISHDTKSQKKITHTKHSFSRMFKVVLVHQPHYTEIFFGLAKRLIIKAPPVYTYKLALSTDTKILFTINHLKPVIHRPSFFKFFFKNSRSISNCPILAYNFSRSFSSLSAARVLSNNWGALSRNSFFHRVIMFGCIPYFLESSLKVSRSCKASIATFALKAPECFCLFDFIMHWFKVIKFKLNQWSYIKVVLYLSVGCSFTVGGISSDV